MNRFYTVLCEDLQAFVFVRRALIEAGAEGRNVFPHPYPDSRFNASGGGSPRDIDGYTVYACGSQHVRMSFPRTLANVRVQHAKREAALVVHPDVDNSSASGRTVRDRLRELDVACSEAGIPVRNPNDPVAVIVPRREIETWIHFLSGSQVDERTQYPKFAGREADCQPAAETFARHARAATSPPSSPPSLVSVLSEFGKIV